MHLKHATVRAALDPVGRPSRPGRNGVPFGPEAPRRNWGLSGRGHATWKVIPLQGFTPTDRPLDLRRLRQEARLGVGTRVGRFGLRNEFSTCRRCGSAWAPGSTRESGLGPWCWSPWLREARHCCRAFRRATRVRRLPEGLRRGRGSQATLCLRSEFRACASLLIRLVHAARSRSDTRRGYGGACRLSQRYRRGFEVERVSR